MAAVAMETTKKNTKNLKCLELDETFQKYCPTRVHIILRLSNFRMAAVATNNVKSLRCSEYKRGDLPPPPKKQETKDRAIRTPLKPWVNSFSPEG
jgi:hypothetical protein